MTFRFFMIQGGPWLSKTNPYGFDFSSTVFQCQQALVKQNETAVWQMLQKKNQSCILVLEEGFFLNTVKPHQTRLVRFLLCTPQMLQCFSKSSSEDPFLKILRQDIWHETCGRLLETKSCSIDHNMFCAITMYNSEMGFLCTSMFSTMAVNLFECSSQPLIRLGLLQDTMQLLAQQRFTSSSGTQCNTAMANMVKSPG